MNHVPGPWARGLLLVLCLCLACASAPMHGRADELKTVRVGFFAFDGYHMQDEAGTRSGYGYELLQRLSGYTNWRYEFIGYEKSWQDMQDMLLAGEIDLMTSAQMIPERLDLFAFSDEPVGTSSTILTVKSGNVAYAMGDYTNWNGMRVGMLTGNSRNESFARFAAERAFTYAPVYYDSLIELVDALKTHGAIDAIVTSNLRAIKDEWVLAQFDPSPFYAAVRKGDEELLAEVNDALSQLFIAEPGLRTRLMNKYYAPDSGDEIPYTLEERVYIERMRGTPLIAVVSPNHEPYSYVEDGKLTGILYDVALEIISRAGLTVQIAQACTMEEYARLISLGEYDIRLDAGDNYTRAEELGYRLTVPYITVPISRLFLRDTYEFKTGAMVLKTDLNQAQIDALEQNGVECAYYDTIDDVVDAVRSGKQDAGYMNSSAALLAMRNEETNRLMAEELHGYESRYTLGVSARHGRLLYSVLNKAASSITQSQIDAVRERYAKFEEAPFTLIGYMYDYPGHVLAFVAAVLFIAALLTTLYLQVRKRRLGALRLSEEARRNALLSDALTAAENAGTAKSQFLSRMSHEMRTPLNAIIGFMDLTKEASPEQAREYISNANIAAKQLLAVINDVLDMSSIESGKLKITNTPFDFKQLIHSLTSIYLPLCEQKGIAYETRVLTHVDEWLVGDPLRLNQILINLLGNAVKFTQKGHVHLTVSEHAPGGKEVFLRFEVSDTGIGMSEEMQSRLFKPFEQESAVTAQKFGGSGLGLSIVKSLITMMNGAIRAESAPGKGTTFIVDLPFGKIDMDEGFSKRQDIAHLRVLAVDDDESDRKYLSAMMDRMRVRYTCASDGDEALRELTRAEEKHDPYSVCLVDWRMPHLDGYETTRRIREQYGKDMIVIIVSAFDQQQASERAKEAGANLFVSKPLFQSTLFDLFITLTGGEIMKDQTVERTRDYTGKRVLLAEDNVMNRMIATALLKKFNIECDSVSDGEQAVRRFEASAAGAYDAILMDIQMPVMDGYAATAAIRALPHPSAKSVQIIALTADVFSEDIAKALSAGMNAHVAKPIEPNDLADALEKAFQHPSA